MVEDVDFESEILGHLGAAAVTFLTSSTRTGCLILRLALGVAGRAI
jgi:hypothetical protein